MWQIADRLFSTLGPETGHIEYLAKKKFALICNIQKAIWALVFRSSEKFDKSFFFKIFGIV